MSPSEKLLEAQARLKDALSILNDMDNILDLGDCADFGVGATREDVGEMSFKYKTAKAWLEDISDDLTAKVKAYLK